MFDVPVDKVIVDLQHAEFGALVDEETYVEGKGVLHDAFVHLYLVCVVGHNIQLAEPLVVDERRCADLGTILDIVMSIDVGDRLPIPGISKKFHRVCNDGFFGVRVSSTSSGRYGFSEPLKAGVGFVLDDLVHAIHCTRDPLPDRAPCTISAAVWRAGACRRESYPRACDAALT